MAGDIIIGHFTRQGCFSGRERESLSRHREEEREGERGEYINWQREALNSKRNGKFVRFLGDRGWRGWLLTND